MPDLKTYIVQADNGGVKFKTEFQKLLFRKFLNDNDGKDIWMTLDLKKPKRSTQQNNFYWLYLEVISKESGHSVLEIHEWAKGKFLSRGIKQVFGNAVRVKKSTTELNKSEFTEYIMAIEEHTGIPAPDPKAAGFIPN